MKDSLILKPTEYQGLKVGIKKDGTNYSVRDDRSSYFYPQQWIQFLDNIKKEKQIIFKDLIQTGARIDEELNIKPEHYDFDRKTLTLFVTKRKAKKLERVGKKRVLPISTEYCKEAKRNIEKNKINEGELIHNITQQAVYQMFKRGLERAKIKDVWQYSLHNIRKTHGNWLKALGIPAEEICLRLGHDFNTYLKHYGSPNIYSQQDKILMIKILGDVYGFK